MSAKRIAAGVCAVTMLILGGCVQELPGQKQKYEKEQDIIEVSETTLARKIPSSFKGSGEIFNLKESDCFSASAVTLYPVTLHCSDGVDRQSYSLTTEPVYLSESKSGNDIANGVCSSSSNLTLFSQVGLMEGNTMEDVLDGVIERQAYSGSESSALMVSNTLRPSSNVFLTDVIYTEGEGCLETFYVLDMLDKETVQMYILSRTYEDMEFSEAEIDDLGIDGLMRYCMSSDENRDVFCGVLQALLAELDG